MTSDNCVKCGSYNIECTYCEKMSNGKTKCTYKCKMCGNRWEAVR